MNASKAALAAALAAGLIGAVVNWVYLDGKSKQLEKIELLSIAPGSFVQPGDKFTEEKLAPLAIPKDNLSKELAKEALRYADRQTVIGMTATYNFEGGEVILRQRLKTPPPTVAYKSEDERGLPIPVDTRSFVPSLVNPGDMVSFVIGMAPAPPLPTEPSDGPPGTGSDAGNPGPMPTPAVRPGMAPQVIGPFRVLSVGNRLGSADVMKASGVAQLQENVMTIAVRIQGEQLEPKAAKLVMLLRTSGTQQAGVLLHPRTNK